jgi:hypothetical protein
MKCKYGDVWLTGTPWQEDCGEVQWSAQQLVQVTPLVGGVTPHIAGRGNLADRIPVPIILSLADTATALRHCAELPWLLPTEGILRFEEGSLVIQYAKAAFNTVTRRRSGLSVELVFDFTVSGPPTFT